MVDCSITRFALLRDVVVKTPSKPYYIAVTIEDCFDPVLKLLPPSDLKYFTIDRAMIEAARKEE